MAYKYLNNMEIEDALHLYLSKLCDCNQLGTEMIPVAQSLGRITSEALYAKISSPHYNASAMDGIALRASITFGASDTTPVTLCEEADFIRVDTGDAIPDTYDAVVMVEDVIDTDRKEFIKLTVAVSPWQNIRQIGEDICENDMILPANFILNPASIGAAMAGGILQIRVWEKPIVGIIPTGDEIVAPTDNPAKGEIIEFNSSIFSAILLEMGAIPKTYPITPDSENLIRQAVDTATAECDIVIVNAGSSAGREDYTSKVLLEMGEVFVHGIAIKPGKPSILAIVKKRPVIGVPGYPVSGIIVMEKIVKKVIAYIMKIQIPAVPKINAILTKTIVSSLKYEEFVRVKLGYVDGRMVVTPLGRGAAMVTSFVKADGILNIPINSEGYMAGREVSVELLKSEDAICRALVMIGSHDPLIDVISDIISRNCDYNYSISSSHVGSMGGITAIRNRETHLAAIHLLDESTGEYNKSYIEKYLGKGNTLLIRGVKRQQGFIVARGNPKNITNIHDIFDEKRQIKYVNRQKGSGTRILLDYLLNLHQLNKDALYGYEREEFTHMNVAAIIASGNADVGLGIFSAAKIFNLDFVPVCEENYDFIAVNYKSGKLDDRIETFINILKSEDFKRRLLETGGYTIDETIGDMTLI
jgi:putative molybdopterin biosynthesis protein